MSPPCLKDLTKKVRQVPMTSHRTERRLGSMKNEMPSLFPNASPRSTFVNTMPATTPSEQFNPDTIKMFADSQPDLNNSEIYETLPKKSQRRVLKLTTDNNDSDTQSNANISPTKFRPTLNQQLTTANYGKQPA